MIHGILHLVGYVDKSEADRAFMRRKEDHYLRQRSFLEM
jgi:ssRNA-specific RNase YbeY (16S rRNA maturation enzyme)